MCFRFMYFIHGYIINLVFSLLIVFVSFVHHGLHFLISRLAGVLEEISIME